MRLVLLHYVDRRISRLVDILINSNHKLQILTSTSIAPSKNTIKAIRILRTLLIKKKGQ